MTTILNSALWHTCVLIATGLWLYAVPLLSYGLEMSVPAGVQDIGKKLQLKSTLSGIPEGTESQLRSTCMRSRIQSIDTATSGRTIDVWVNFEPTIRQGGMVEFESVSPINHALVQLELVSECPLLTFTSRWTLIMNQNQSVPEQTTETGNTKLASNNFDPASSSILAKSRISPTRRINLTPAYDAPNSTPNVVEKHMAESVAVNESQADTPIKSTDEPIRIASLGTNLIGNGLIESRKGTGSSHSGLGLNDEQSIGSIGALGLSQLHLMALATGLLILTVLIYLTRKYRLFGGASIRKGRPSGPSSMHEPQLTEFRHNAELDTSLKNPVNEVSHSPEVFGQDRFLESLIAHDEDSTFQNEMASPPHTDDTNLQDVSSRSSLKISLELINRADSRKWNLPEAYHGLIEQRNRSLEQSKMTEALILRSQIGLVELAFQDAKQGGSTQSQTALDLLMLVLGEHLYDAEVYPSLGVPDVVKSHVRAKMCEISGADLRQLLRENLVNLNTQVNSSALCFHLDAWREFLSEEGMLS
ncbi:hypothetical protein [Limnobacter parvus]|uniref:Uncharacterized protein n=1 Tax=Limnobacter parvus TaxID=2939690 RepID=A0ABT1XJC8_9BURK|nr:hypothetical protein [Limnobacter parvus]MCR2746994.1 hypothetical protein [Limnobacter parvus]